MAKQELIAIHRIAISAGKEGLKYIEPGDSHSFDEETAKSLIKSKAARPAQKSAPADTNTVDAEELQRMQMLESAKEEGVKGLNKNSTAETISKKLAEHRQAQIDADAAKGDDDDEDVM